MQRNKRQKITMADNQIIINLGLIIIYFGKNTREVVRTINIIILLKLNAE